MILKPQVESQELQETIDWYKMNFEHVELVYCGSELGLGCGALLALEIRGGQGLQMDERGVSVQPIGSKLLASRVRLDEHADGRMMGYQCICGNDTRLSKAEKHHKPTDGWYNPLARSEDKKIAEAIKKCGHEAQFKESDNVKQYESFKVERAN